MKTIFKTLISFAVAAIAFAACSQDELNTPNSNDPITLKFNITKAAETVEGKAVLGTEDNKTFLNWEDGDEIGTFSMGSFSGNQSASNNNPGTVNVSGDECILNVQSSQPGDITTIYSYFPHSASAGKIKEAAIVTIPESQSMSNSGFDADAMPMAGTPVSVDITMAHSNTDTPCGTINFSNLGSIINFKIYSSTACDETITSVKYIGENVGGAFSIDLTSIDPESEASLALTASDPVSAITTNCTNHPSLSSKTNRDNAIDIFMVVAPGTYSNTQVVVTTNAYTYTLDASNAKTFTRSHVKPMYVDIQNGTKGDLPLEETWSKVTSAANFTAGTYYILRGDEQYYLSNAVASSGAPACNAFAAGASIPQSMRWTATEGENGLVFESLSHAGNYLWGWNTSNGIRVTSNSPSNGASKEWTFHSLSVGETTYYTAYAVSGRYLISYGDQDWRSYANGSNDNIPAEFYKLDVVDNRTVVNLSFAESAVNKTTANYSSFAGQTAGADPDATDITDHITYSITGDEIGEIVTSTGVVTLNGTVGEATVTATFAGDETYKPATVSYTIAVTEAPNRYVKATSIVSGEKYLIVGVKSGNTYLATPIPSSKTYAYPAGHEVTSNVVDANTIEISGESDYLFTLTTSGIGYTIKQPDGRYIYASGSYATLNVGTTQGVWTFEKQNNDSYKITESATGDNTYIQFGQGDYTTFGRYSSDQTNASLPFLYVLDDGKVDPGISYTPASATVTFGETLAQPTLSNEHGLAVTYASNETGVATVASNGTIAVVGAGSAKITASWIEQEINSVTYRAGSTSFNLTVLKATPTIAAFNNPTTSVSVGSTVTNTTTISNDLTITYTSSDQTIATVTSAGVVSGLKDGTVIISATFTGNDNYNEAVSQTYTLTVGTGGILKTWKLVTDSSTALAVGDQILIVNDSYTFAAKRNSSGNNMQSASVASADDGATLSTVSADAAIITLGKDNSKWTLSVDTNTYLYAAGGTGSSPKNNLKETSTIDQKSRWTIEFNENNAIITCEGGATRNTIRHNASNNPPLFSCYASTSQSAVRVYRYE